MSNVRAAVVGTGHMGKYHTSAYTELRDVDLAGVVDIDKQNVEQLAEIYGTQAYTDYRELFGKVDVVSLAVPTRLHFEIAKDLLDHGISVLVEKPISHSLQEATELFKVAEKNHVVVHVGHVERFNGAVQELKNVIEDPIFLESRRIGPYARRIVDDGVILDLMIHDIDIVLNLVDSPVIRMSAMGGKVVSDKEDFVNAQILFESGCVANIIASRVSEEKIRTLSVSQRGAYVILDYTDQEILIHRQASSDRILTRDQIRYKQESFVERIFVHKENPLKLEIKHFIKCATDSEEPLNSVEKELRSLKAALQIRDLLRADGVIGD